MLKTELIHNLSTTYSEGNFDHIILFIHGGALKGGKDKFKRWQEDLEKIGIGSVSFDFPGIDDSPGRMELTSLESRIHLTQLIILWIQNNLKPKKLSIYGLSMGGYVALGAAHKNRHLNGRIILHAPAAFAQEAHDVRFGPLFTQILHKEKSYENSFAFEWMQDVEQPVTLIVHSEDEVIPKEITDRYREIGSFKDNFRYKEIIGAEHRIWEGSDRDFQDQVFEMLRGA